MKNSISALKHIVSHAYNETDYYRQLFDSAKINIEKINEVTDLSAIPILTRDDILEKESSFLAKPYNKFPDKDRLLLKRGLCTSGHIMKIYWDENDEARFLENLQNLRKEQYGIDTESVVCSFHGSRYVGNKLAYHKEKVLSHDRKFLSFSILNLTDEKVKSYLEAMSKIGVNWLQLRPGIAIILAEAINRNNLSLPRTLKYVELVGEGLHDEDRKLIQNAFQTKLAFLYRNTETGPIAYECKYNELHVSEDNVLVEIIDNGQPVEGESGNICVTSLSNHAMPIIRLNTDNAGELLDVSCPCGNSAPILRLKNEQSCDFFYAKDGQKISSEVLKFLVEQTNEFMSGAIQRFYIKQNEAGNFTIECLLKQEYKNWREAIMQTFLANISEPRLQDAKWSFNFL